MKFFRFLPGAALAMVLAFSTACFADDADFFKLFGGNASGRQQMPQKNVLDGEWSGRTAQGDAVTAIFRNGQFQLFSNGRLVVSALYTLTGNQICLVDGNGSREYLPISLRDGVMTLQNTQFRRSGLQSGANYGQNGGWSQPGYGQGGIEGVWNGRNAAGNAVTFVFQQGHYQMSVNGQLAEAGVYSVNGSQVCCTAEGGSPVCLPFTVQGNEMQFAATQLTRVGGPQNNGSWEQPDPNPSATARQTSRFDGGWALASNGSQILFLMMRGNYIFKKDGTVIEEGTYFPLDRKRVRFMPRTGSDAGKTLVHELTLDGRRRTLKMRFANGNSLSFTKIRDVD
ncbi:MAG: hypothetical protein K6F46_06975 [Desulfovibrio sp.]|nr:hypothetical protein [Desulfovibrio sp.]